MWSLATNPHDRTAASLPARNPLRQLHPRPRLLSLGPPPPYCVLPRATHRGSIWPTSPLLHMTYHPKPSFLPPSQETATCPDQFSPLSPTRHHRRQHRRQIRSTKKKGNHEKTPPKHKDLREGPGLPQEHHRGYHQFVQISS